MMTNKLKTTLMVALTSIFLLMTTGNALSKKPEGGAPGKNKVDLCHYDDDDGEYKLISVPAQAYTRHILNHHMDDAPNADGECGEPPAPTDCPSEILAAFAADEPWNTPTQGGSDIEGYCTLSNVNLGSAAFIDAIGVFGDIHNGTPQNPAVAIGAIFSGDPTSYSLFYPTLEQAQSCAVDFGCINFTIPGE